MNTTPSKNYENRIIWGDCLAVMQSIPSESVDFILTDPPYLVNYRSRDGRR
jgi:adenine-specific DNA-methyltransferase